MSINEFTFYKHMDSVGYDAIYVGPKTIDELKQICISNKRCVGFNSLGYLKFNFQEKDQFKKLNIYTKDNDGLYIYTKRFNKLKVKINNKYIPQFDGYTFYSGQDSPGDDLMFVGNKSILEIKELCEKYNNCVGFNTMGFLKSKIKPINEFNKLDFNLLHEGLYVKKQKFRIKMLCNWCNSYELCTDWNRMSKGNYKWNDLEITWEDKDIDFYVIINKPRQGDKFVPERTIIFHMEPWCPDSKQNWGIKTWGQWAKPDESKFIQVRSHEKYYNNAFWQLNATYNDLKTMQISKTKLLSTICSSKYFDPGHIKRIDFLKYIESKNDDIIKIDIYNSDNVHKFKNYVGPHPPNYKDAGILPYKYYFMGENNVEKNFITEKIWESLLTETLCFYWGCPNIDEYIDPRAYILLDLDNFEDAFNKMKNAIINNEWEKRIEIIRREKQKVLEYYNFFPTLERVLKHDFKFNYKPNDDEIIYHKYFHDIINKNISNICFIHSCNLNGNLDILNSILNKITDSELFNSLDFIYIVNIGQEINDIDQSNKIKVINYSTNNELFEFPTINLIHLFSKFNDKSNILYLHTKGVSYEVEYDYIRDWRNFMLHFLVDKYKFCLDILDLYDTVGCNLLVEPLPHYSGNFWWARSCYIYQNLTKFTNFEDRHECEFWLLNSGNAKSFCLYDTNINHYEDGCPKELYDNPETNKMFDEFYEFDDKTRIKCINLERRQDRKQKLTMELNKNGLSDNADFFKAIDGQKLIPNDELINLFQGNDFGSRRSFIGCALSHYTLWQQLQEDENYDKYLILEDDIEIDKNLAFKLNMIYDLISDREFDILYLGYHFYRKNKIHYDNKVKNLKGYKIDIFDTSLYIGGFFGYIITKTGANKLLNFIKENGIKHGIDYLTLRYIKEMNLIQYEILPHIITSEYVDYVHKVDSDIQYNHNKLF